MGGGIMRTCGDTGESACRVPLLRPLWSSARDWRTGVPDKADAATAQTGAPQGAKRTRPCAPMWAQLGRSDPLSLHLQVRDPSTWSPAVPGARTGA